MLGTISAFNYKHNNNKKTTIGLSPGGSGYFTCIQNMKLFTNKFTCIQNTKLVTNKFKSAELHEKYVVATWNVGNHLSICF